MNLLRANQPTHAVTTLLYRLIEKDCGISLLQPQSIEGSNKADIAALFLASRYEEVLEKTNVSFQNYGEKRYFHPAALALLGRTKEAIELLDKYFPSEGRDATYSLIQVLGGDREYLDDSYYFEEEFMLNCPLPLFTKWLQER